MDIFCNLAQQKGSFWGILRQSDHIKLAFWDEQYLDASLYSINSISGLPIDAIQHIQYNSMCVRTLMLANEKEKGWIKLLLPWNNSARNIERKMRRLQVNISLPSPSQSPGQNSAAIFISKIATTWPQFKQRFSAEDGEIARRTVLSREH